MNRREFLGKSLICGLALDRAFLRAAQARAQSLNTPATPLFSIEKLGENVFAAIAKPVTLLNCNALIFVNFNDILVVDSHSKPSAAAALVAQVRREVRLNRFATSSTRTFTGTTPRVCHITGTSRQQPT